MLFHVGLTGGFENCQPRLISWGWSIQKAHRTERLQTFAYDAFGNKAVTAGVQNGQPNHTPTALSQFNTHNQWSTACSTPPCYDAGGNQTLVAGDVYTYDGENRIASANAQNMGATTYGYDGFGHRIWKSNAVGMTVYAYDAGGELTAEYSNTPTTVTGTEYMSADHLGSTRVITDASGNLVRRYDYVPFGQEIASGIDGRGSDYGSAIYPATQDFQSKKFTGKERDAETGLDYFGARYFSSAQGRFTSPDEPLKDQYESDPQSWNLYSYGRNNPLRYIDPTGRCSVKADGGPATDDPGTPCVAPKDSSVTVNGNSDDSTTYFNGLGQQVGYLPYNPAIKSVDYQLLGGLALARAGIGAAATLLSRVGPRVAPVAPLLPELGRKLDFLFGRSGGQNAARSLSMLQQLQKIGLNDTAETRQYISGILSEALNNPSSIVQAGDRTVRESLVMGPGGAVKLQSIWEGTKLITFKVFGGQ